MINRYDAGELNVTGAPVQVILERKEARHILIYPTVDCYVKLNDSSKEIFMPARTWTPVSIEVNNFSVRTVKDTGVAYWQAWYV